MYYIPAYTHTLNYLIISSRHIVFMLYLTSHFSWFFSHNGLIVSGLRDLIIACRDGTLVILRLSLPRKEEEEKEESSFYIGRYMIAASLRESLYRMERNRQTGNVVLL